MADLDIAAIRKAWLDDRIGTHWAGCETSHQRCAIARLCDEVERLRVELHHAAALLRQTGARLNLGCVSVRGSAVEWCEKRDALLERHP